MSSEDRQRLESWKAIARHLDRSVRTVRRWEAAEGLPVHRQMHQRQGRIFAYVDELDAWLARRAVAPESLAGHGAPASTADGDEPAPAVDRRRSPSIGVLPFAYLGPDEGSAYLADGLTDDLITDLSSIRDLRVISRTSMMTLKGSTETAQAIADRLDVRYLLEGSLREAAGRLRITVRLIDAGRDDRVWASRYDCVLDGLFDTEARLAKDVLEAMALELSQEERRGLAPRAAAELPAWTCVQQARAEALRWHGDAIDLAVALLNEGLRQGENVSLLAALGRTWLQYREAGLHGSEDPLQQASACAARIAAIDADAPALHQLKGWICYAEGDVQGAVIALKRALAVTPDDTDALSLLANCYLIAGRVSIMRPIADRLLSIDPLTPLNRCLPGYAEVLEGHPDRAVPAYRDMFELDRDNPVARLFLIWLQVVRGETDAATRLFEGYGADQLMAPPARVAERLVRAARGEALDPEPGPELEALARASDFFPRLLACAQALAGDVDGAVAWLQRALESGFINYPYLAEHDAVFVRLRGETAYEAFLERVRVRWEAFAP